MLVGRSRERARVERLLEDARDGRSSALLLHGEPGIGKTALLRWAAEQAADMRVLRVRGIETESDIPFAGLGELVAPLLDRLDAIPAPQAAALRGALALGPAAPGDRFTAPAGARAAGGAAAAGHDDRARVPARGRGAPRPRPAGAAGRGGGALPAGRAGRREDAARVLARLSGEAARTGSLWARTTAARCAALMAPDDEMRGRFDAALALHASLPMPFERARTLLVLGERLRRARQRAEARAPLQEALDAFERLGARPWAERARTELRATGQPSGRRSEAAAEQLTPHELQIALLVAQGMTNREAAAALFLSPKTIEYHLGQIYRKLDVRGRAQLARLMAMELPEGESDPAVLAEALS